VSIVLNRELTTLVYSARAIDLGAVWAAAAELSVIAAKVRIRHFVTARLPAEFAQA
jgi:hypothetical protein